MDLQWTIYLQKHDDGERLPIGSFRRKVDGAVAADFGLSLAEAREMLVALQHAVVHDQIVAFDAQRRHCRHCGRYRRIKDWRPRVFTTSLGEIRVRVPRVISCLCTPEPLDENDDPTDFRYSECSIEPLLPGRRTPEVFLPLRKERRFDVLSLRCPDRRGPGGAPDLV
jgi:hypothetical protein